MTRSSKRELERAVEDLDPGSGNTAADDWRQYIAGEISYREYRDRRSRGGT